MKLLNKVVLLLMTMVSLINGDILGNIETEYLGPQPFTKEKAIHLDTQPPKEDPFKTTNNNLGVNNIDQDLSKYKNIDDESNRLNLSLNLLPSFNNDTSGVFDKSQANKPTEVLKQPSLVKKPSGTLYVDSVHNFQDRVSPLRMAGAPGCKIDEDLDGAEDDPYRLSASQFGFPKSIVSKALEDSPFKSVLNVLATLQYYNQQQIADEGSSRNKKQAQSAHSFPEYASPPQDTRNFNDNTNAISYPKNIENSYNAYNTFPVKKTDSKQGDRVTNPFLSRQEYQNSYGSSAGNDQFAPHLLDGSVFGSAFKPTNYNSNNNNNNNDNNNVNGYNSINNKDNGMSEASSKDPQKNDTVTSKYPGPKTLNLDNDNIKFNPGVQQNRGQTANNQFSKYLPDVSGGSPWNVASNSGFNSYNNFGSQRSVPYQGDNKLIGVMKTLFPPKKSESLPEISGLKDLIPTSNPVIKYSDKQKSNVDSPFEFNIKSIFGSIPGSTVGLGKRPGGSNSGLGEDLTGSSTGIGRDPRGSTYSTSAVGGPRNFGFFGVENINSPPSNFDYKGGDPTASGTQNHNEIRFAQYRARRRRRRDTSESQPTTRDACKTSHQVLRQYQNHGGACFVVVPEVQGIQFATCQKTTCSDCNVNGGTSRCRPVRVPVWVWAYCESGPRGGTVAPDRVDVTVACTCKVTHCRQIPLGMS